MILLDNPSQEDLHDLWALELQSKGYIKKQINQENINPFVLVEEKNLTGHTEKVVYKGTKREQSRKEEHTHYLCSSVTYTPDRCIVWEKKARGLFFVTLEGIKHNLDRGTKTNLLIAQELEGEMVTFLDVKSPFTGVNQSDVSFSVKSKWVFDKFNIYINKVTCYPYKKLKRVGKKYLWCNTFTPSRYLLTDKATKKRTIRNWAPVTLEEYIKNPLR